MSFRAVRQSKFRHVFGKAEKKDNCYDGIKVSRNAWDSPFCSINTKFLAVVLEAQGGGAFMVLPLTKTGRVDLNEPKICGHTSAVLDVMFCPYNENLVASSSEDCMAMIWEIPDGGLTANLSDPLVTLMAHQRRVGIVNWHPLAENVILTAGFDYLVCIWDIAAPDAPIVKIECHTDTIYSTAWNLNGSLLATTSKDKQLRIINPQTGAVKQEGHSHDGTKASRVVFIGDNDMLLTTGFSKMSERQYGVWKPDDLSKPAKLEMIDTGSGVLFAHYDPDTRMIYVAGKGDGNIRYYEVTDEAPYVHYLSQYQCNQPQRGVAFMPKTGCNVNICEVAKAVKLHPKGFAEIVGFTVPRKSTLFQDDLFPETREPVSTGNVADFKAGKTFVEKKISLKGGYTAASRKAAVAGAGMAPKPTHTAADDGVPKGEPALTKAFHAHETEIKDLKKHIATLEIKLRAAMNALDSK